MLRRKSRLARKRSGGGNKSATVRNFSASYSGGKWSSQSGGWSKGFSRGNRTSKNFSRSREGRRSRVQKTATASKERISLESGYLLLIDQFMLANDFMLNELEQLKDASFEKREELIRKFGGELVKLEPGEYKIARDPFKFYLAVYPEKSEFSESELDKSMKPIGEVFVNTRCLALVDWELLNDFEFLKQYSELWNAGKDKKCRDLIREAGGAVRYGFNRHGDELGVHLFKEASRLYMWPINEPEGNIDDEHFMMDEADNRD